MSRKSTQVALGGIFSSLCLLLMFMTGMVPFSLYVLPAVAGAMLVAVVVEIGARTAVLVYICVSVLSVFIAPDREAAVMFIVFFGYYPILKERLERLHPRWLEVLAKLLVFNVSMIAGYYASIYLVGLDQVVGELGAWGRYGELALLGVGNVVFLIYDLALTRYVCLYLNWFKPTFLRR